MEDFSFLFDSIFTIVCFYFFSKSEKSTSLVRDDSFSKIINHSDFLTANKRLASAPPENSPLPPSSTSQRRSRFDGNNSHEHLPSSTNETIISDIMSNSVTAASSGNAIGSSKNRFFSLSRRFRFRVQSPDKATATPPASVHFLDEDIDLETKERTTRKSDQHGNRPSKGILKTLRHRSPFRFRSKDAVILEQEPSPPPPPTPVVPPSSTSVSQPAPKEARQKIPPPAPTKQRGRLVELKKTTPKSTSSNGASRKPANPTPTTEPTGSTLVRRASGLKDLIHKFEVTPSDRPPKPKRTAMESGSSTVPSTESNQEEQVKKSMSYSDLPTDDHTRAPSLVATNKSKTIDIPDLLRNVDKDPMGASSTAKAILRHSNSSRQTTSFDSATSMVSASESIATNSSARRPTSTARPLMISLVSSFLSIIQSEISSFF